jgi:hypothetical protein
MIEKTKKRSGQAVIEMALILPLLIMLALGTIEFGMIFVKSSRLTSAIRKGARAGSLGMAPEYIKKRVLINSGLKEKDLKIDIDFPKGRKPGDFIEIAGTYNHIPMTPVLGKKSIRLFFKLPMSIESN